VVKTYNISEIDKIAAEVWEEGQGYKTWVFDASMGSGKTTLIHALCEMLGVKDAISSPTFALMNEYASPVAGTIFHMDWYRLKDAEDAIHAGMEDALLSGHYCFVEWPEKAAEILPEEVFTITITVVDEFTRHIITGAGPFLKKD